MRNAAEESILHSSAGLENTRIDASEIYTMADAAFDALDILLGEDDWFSGTSEPDLFDAGVFAYTGLILDERRMMGWKDNRLSETLRVRRSLVRHAERITERWYSTGQP